MPDIHYVIHPNPLGVGMFRTLWRSLQRRFICSRRGHRWVTPDISTPRGKIVALLVGRVCSRCGQSERLSLLEMLPWTTIRASGTKVLPSVAFRSVGRHTETQ